MRKKLFILFMQFYLPMNTNLNTNSIESIISDKLTSSFFLVAIFNTVNDTIPNIIPSAIL